MSANISGNFIHYQDKFGCVPLKLYQSFPGEDVGIETEPILGHIEPTMDQDVTLKSTGIV